MYRRVFRGRVAPGKHGEFQAALQEALDHQLLRGIDARFTVWDALTGPNNEIEVISEFDSLSDLEKFEDLVAQDAAFAELRQRVRAAMLFETTSVALYRKMEVSPA